jgi:nucleotide-binding universal stress UspA family protein
MLRTIAVHCGGAEYQRFAERHALELAKLFKARLRAVVPLDGVTVEKMRQSGTGDTPEGLTEQTTREILKQAKAAGLEGQSVMRPEGVIEGLREEARKADLLVVGMPTRADATGDAMAEIAMDEELSLVRNVECSLLVAAAEPTPLRNVLVSYQGGAEGKAALRAAGSVAERAGARVNVTAIHGDLAHAEALTAAALQYLEGYKLEGADGLEFHGSDEAPNQILDAARDTDADLIVLGCEPYGILKRFFSGSKEEAVIVTTHKPVLIAR